MGRGGTHRHREGASIKTQLAILYTVGIVAGLLLLWLAESLVNRALQTATASPLPTQSTPSATHHP